MDRMYGLVVFELGWGLDADEITRPAESKRTLVATPTEFLLNMDIASAGIALP